MSDDLKPCPFCTEGKSVSTYFDHEQGDKWGYAACDACESRGPEVRTGYDPADDAPWRAEAIAAWNTRTPDPSIEALTAERAKAKLSRAVDVLSECLERNALLEARLGKVVDVLQAAVKWADSYRWAAPWVDDAHTTLAEIELVSEEGEKT
jgi:Lar family restriction alleviation protein